MILLLLFLGVAYAQQQCKKSVVEELWFNFSANVWELWQSKWNFYFRILPDEFQFSSGREAMKLNLYELCYKHYGLRTTTDIFMTEIGYFIGYRSIPSWFLSNDNAVATFGLLLLNGKEKDRHQILSCANAYSHKAFIPRLIFVSVVSFSVLWTLLIVTVGLYMRLRDR
jgi:hypothetical protein